MVRPVTAINAAASRTAQIMQRNARLNGQAAAKKAQQRLDPTKNVSFQPQQAPTLDSTPVAVPSLNAFRPTKRTVLPPALRRLQDQVDASGDVSSYGTDENSSLRGLGTLPIQGIERNLSSGHDAPPAARASAASDPEQSAQVQMPSSALPNDSSSTGKTKAFLNPAAYFNGEKIHTLLPGGTYIIGPVELRYYP